MLSNTLLNLTPPAFVQLRTIDGRNMIPLQLACTGKDISSDVIRLLLDFWPEASFELGWGDLPLSAWRRDRPSSLR